MRRLKWTSWATLAGLLSIITIVVYTSLDVGAVRCEVCIAFEGREVCRAVDGQTEADARQAAITNTCALLTSGVTKTLACERTPPTREQCAPR